MTEQRMNRRRFIEMGTAFGTGMLVGSFIHEPPEQRQFELERLQKVGLSEYIPLYQQLRLFLDTYKVPVFSDILTDIHSFTREIYDPALLEIYKGEWQHARLGSDTVRAALQRIDTFKYTVGKNVDLQKTKEWMRQYANKLPGKILVLPNEIRLLGEWPRTNNDFVSLGDPSNTKTQAEWNLLTDQRQIIILILSCCPAIPSGY